MKANSTVDGIYIMSDKPIVKKKKMLVCSERTVKGKSLDDLLLNLSGKSDLSYVAEGDSLYKVDGDVKRLPKVNRSLAELLIEDYSIDTDYIGLLRKNKSVILESGDGLFEVLGKARKRSLPNKSRKELLKKVDELIDAYFSPGFFKSYKEKSILRKARKVPEQNIYSKMLSSISTIVAKSDRNRVKKSILEEIKRMYSNGRYDLIVGLKTSDMSLKAEIAEKLSRDVGSKDFFVFKNIPYIVVPCSKKDADKLCYSLNNRQRKYFSKVSPDMDAIEKVQVSDVSYTPELFMKIAADFNLFKFHEKDIGKNIGWNLRNIHAPAAWHTTRGKGSSVLVIDTGTDYNHLDLKDCFGDKKGYNFVAGNDNPLDDNGHGTHVAGIVAGRRTGVAPMATLYAAKVLSKSGVGSSTDVIRAIDYAVENDFDIANMSLGSPRFSYAYASMCKKAYERGVILVAAAGNHGYGAEYPAAYDGVISVAAVTADNIHPGFSNIHKTVDISCPGVQIYSTFPGNDYKSCTGTSMATPHAAGVAALGLSVKNSMGPSGYEKVLKDTAFELGKGESYQKEKYGAGLAQADKLVDKLYSSVFRRFGRWI